MPHMPQVPQALFVEGNMNNAELRDSLMNLTQLMMAQTYVVTNHLVAQGNPRDRPQLIVSTPTSRIRDLMRMNPLTLHGTTNLHR